MSRRACGRCCAGCAPATGRSTRIHGASETQCGDDLSIGSCRRAVYAQLTVCQSRHASNVDDVLDADWNAVQRPAKTPRLGLAVEQIGFRPCTVVGDIAPSLHHGINRVDRDRQCSTSALTLSAPKRISFCNLAILPASAA